MFCCEEDICLVNFVIQYICPIDSSMDVHYSPEVVHQFNLYQFNLDLCILLAELSVLKFAESRARELEALSRAVEHVGGTKLSFQRLPRHMRRRAMSHDIRRIPRRLRLKAQAEVICFLTGTKTE